MAELPHTPIHEAGHAVIGRALTMVCGGASIVADDSLEAEGHAVVEGADTTTRQWELREKFRDYASVVRGRILTSMAGREAEAVILGVGRGCDEADREAIEAMSEDVVADPERWPPIEARLRRFTRQFVRRHREDIERVAAALVDRGALSGEEIDSILPPGFMARPLTWALALPHLGADHDP